MNFPLFIARRYLFSRKSTNVINVISGISVVGVAVTTAALLIVLSVFNGFHDVVASLLTNFDPQLSVVPAEGKAAAADDPALAKMKALEQVQVSTECVEDMALAYYKGKQAMVTIKGVEANFDSLTHIKEILYGDGDFTLQAANLQFGVAGIRLAQTLGTGTRWDGFLKVFAPMREGQLTDVASPDEGFVVDSLLSPGVIFAVNQSRYDRGHIITSIGFARRLFDRQGMVTSLEFRLKPGSSLNKVKAEMRDIGGGRFRVLDRFEQQSDTFRIMQVEKVLAYAFLTFILIVACFNIIGSLSMLMIDKKENVATLRSLGASGRQISRVFLFEGCMISVMGAVAGVAAGLLLCWLQQQYGIVSMGRSSGSFVIDAYPVSVHYSDVAAILLTGVAVGCLATWYTVRNAARLGNTEA